MREAEMAKKAYEILSRYFARQIIGVLVLKESDRRRDELATLGKFFNVDLGEGAPEPSLQDRVGGALRGAQQGARNPSSPSTADPASHPYGGTSPRVYADEATPAAKSLRAAKPSGSTSDHDWSKMLARIQVDADLVCQFLEVMATSQRGLAMYHDEVLERVRTSWIGPEGEQSLGRWVSGQCSAVWPEQFSEIEEKITLVTRDLDDLRKLDRN